MEFLKSRLCLFSLPVSHHELKGEHNGRLTFNLDYSGVASILPQSHPLHPQ